MKAGRLDRHLKGSEIPGLAHIVVVLTDVPGMRKVYRFGVSGEFLLPFASSTDLIWIGTEKPVAIQVNRRRGKSRDANDQKKSCAQKNIFMKPLKTANDSREMRTL